MMKTMDQIKLINLYCICFYGHKKIAINTYLWTRKLSIFKKLKGNLLLERLMEIEVTINMELIFLK